MPTILTVDDDADLVKTLAAVLGAKGHRTLGAGSAKEALEVLKREPCDAVLLDLGLEDANGLDLLARIRELDPELPVIILTGETGVATAVKAMRLGARDYLTKPCRNEELTLVVERAIKEQAMEREVEVLRDRLHRESGAGTLVGRGPAITRVLDEAARIAPTDLTVIVQGESGTGKELLARRVHELSTRREGIFVAVDCGTLSETLAESELFGHEKGSFTGAVQRKLGLFEEAHGGTLFLDEIVNLSAAMQAKFLRSIQERRIRRVGGKKDIAVDVRLLVATNVDLLEAVRQGRFREDLYHRLNQYSITVPPLRERLEDLEPLCLHFLEEANRLLKKNVRGISAAAMDQLRAHRWPGNVRELRNAITRAVHLATAQVDVGELALAAPAGTPAASTPLSASAAPVPVPARSRGRTGFKAAAQAATAEAEKNLIREALRAASGNKVRAARDLGINRMTLYLKLKKYGIKT